MKEVYKGFDITIDFTTNPNFYGTKMAIATGDGVHCAFRFEPGGISDEEAMNTLRIAVDRYLESKPQPPQESV